MKIIGTVALGRDAEIKYLPAGAQVMNFSGAFNYGKKGDDGKRPSQWVEFAMFGERVEKIAGYMLKGTRVLVFASDPRIETYTDRDGQVRAKMVARVDDIEFASSQRDQADGAGHTKGISPTQPGSKRTKQRTARPPQQRSGPDDFADDIPF